MRALDRLPPRRGSRAVSPFLGLLVAALLATVLATGISSIARADPPPASCGSTTLGCLELNSQFGQASDPFSASYWFNTGGDACRYTTVQFSWDGGAPVSSPISDVNNCNGKRTFTKAPTPNGLGRHTLKAIGCYQDPSSGRICDDYSSAAATYIVVALTVKPNTGLATADFSATYAMGAGACTRIFPSVRFDWNGDADRRARQVRCLVHGHAQPVRRAETEWSQGVHHPRPGMRCERSVIGGYGGFEVLCGQGDADTQTDPHTQPDADPDAHAIAVALPVPDA